MTDSTFDPGRYLTKVGNADYLEVKWRLVWLREKHPDAQISTSLVAHDPQAQWAMFRAEVTIPGGGSASGHGSEDFRGFKEYIEKAETKAIGRALGALGFGTQFSQDFEHGGVVDTPVDFTRIQRDLPARARTTSENTVPVGGSNGGPGATQAATPRQLKFIQAIAREHGMGDDTLNAETMQLYGRPVGELDRRDASAYIEQLQTRRPQVTSLAGPTSGQPPLVEMSDADRWTS